MWPLAKWAVEVLAHANKRTDKSKELGREKIKQKTCSKIVGRSRGDANKEKEADGREGNLYGSNLLTEDTKILNVPLSFDELSQNEVAFLEKREGNV